MKQKKGETPYGSDFEPLWVTDMTDVHVAWLISREMKDESFLSFWDVDGAVAEGFGTLQGVCLDMLKQHDPQARGAYRGMMTAREEYKKALEAWLARPDVTKALGEPIPAYDDGTYVHKEDPKERALTLRELFSPRSLYFGGTYDGPTKGEVMGVYLDEEPMEQRDWRGESTHPGYERTHVRFVMRTIDEKSEWSVLKKDGKAVLDEKGRKVRIKKPWHRRYILQGGQWQAYWVNVKDKAEVLTLADGTGLDANIFEVLRNICVDALDRRAHNVDLKYEDQAVSLVRQNGRLQAVQNAIFIEGGKHWGDCLWCRKTIGPFRSQVVVDNINRTPQQYAEALRVLNLKHRNEPAQGRDAKGRFTISKGKRLAQKALAMVEKNPIRGNSNNWRCLACGGHILEKRLGVSVTTKVSTKWWATTFTCTGEVGGKNFFDVMFRNHPSLRDIFRKEVRSYGAKVAMVNRDVVKA